MLSAVCALAWEEAPNGFGREDGVGVLEPFGGGPEGWRRGAQRHPLGALGRACLALSGLEWRVARGDLGRWSGLSWGARGRRTEKRAGTRLG